MFRRPRRRRNHSAAQGCRHPEARRPRQAPNHPSARPHLRQSAGGRRARPHAGTPAGVLQSRSARPVHRRADPVSRKPGGARAAAVLRGHPPRGADPADPAQRHLVGANRRHLQRAVARVDADAAAGGRHGGHAGSPARPGGAGRLAPGRRAAGQRDRDGVHSRAQGIRGFRGRW
nr:hypothetical protein fc57 [uncultured bacterium]